MPEPENPTVRELHRRYAEAKAQVRALMEEARTLEARNDEIRRELGNPFYYSGNTDRTDELIDRYTGAKSGEADVRVVLTVRRLDREMRALRVQLLRAGVNLESLRDHSAR
jgi:hypothetical protein